MTPEQSPPPPPLAARVKWLTLAFVLGNLLFAIWILFLRHPPKSGDAPETEATAPTAARARFTEITSAAGIRFVRDNGAQGEKLLPETMGGGVAFFDYNNDGLQDLLFVNSPALSTTNSLALHALALYRNLGSGHFEDVTAGSGLDVSFPGMGVAVGDYDNDGFADLLVTGPGQLHLFHNESNGKFRDVTTEAGLANGSTNWSTSAAFFDYDNDGRLDLFICNYVEWSREQDLAANYTLPRIGRAYGPPMNFRGSFSSLYHNDGAGKFSDVSRKAGIQIRNPVNQQALGKALGVVPVDLDGDGWLDLVVANDTVPNFVFHNERNGTFKEIGGASGIAYSTFGTTRGAMGIDAARFQSDDAVGISIGNFANEMTALYVAQQQPLVFSDEAIRQGIGPTTQNKLTFGVFFFDYDLDGWLDLLTVNGHIEPLIATAFPNQSYQQPMQLFWNGRAKGQNRFIPVEARSAGPDLFRPIAGRGSAFADIDGDGDLDLIVTQVDGNPLLFRNDQQLGHHWIRFKLVGSTSNRDALGAVIRLRVGNRILSRTVMAARGYLSSSELPVTFGLGPAERVTQVEVTWPRGGTQSIENPRIDALNLVRESSRFQLPESRSK